jgi:hypothetical protein
MADYWCKMSAVLGLPREALEFVRQVEAALDGDGDFPADLTAGERELLDDCGRSRADFSWDEDHRAIWVHGDDVDPEWVAGVVRVAIRRFEPGLRWGFEWSNDCSRPRLDAYGGGAVVVTADAVEWTNTGEWLSRRLSGG